MPTFTAGAFGVDFDQIDVGLLATGQVSASGPTSFVVNFPSGQEQFLGSGFVYGPVGFPTAGTISTIQETVAGQMSFKLEGLHLSVTDLANWVASDSSDAAKATLFAGDDLINGSDAADLLRGYGGDDTINGNGGNDLINGGDGNNVIHGGAGDDVIVVTGGSNYLRGDDGDDTESGGPGADIFHSSQDAGVDKILDFNQAEGDRVMLDPGTTYALSQVGADTVIDMGAGNQVILVGVQLSTLTPGWIFGT